MASLRDFLGGNRHLTADAEMRKRAAAVRLGNLLPADDSPLWALTVSPFVSERPWRYWSQETVRVALSLLEQDIVRTGNALQHWWRQIGVGFDALFLKSAAALSDQDVDVFRVRAVVELGAVFHPEYLRLAEHGFGNLLTLYWAVQRKGGVNAKFDLPRAVGEFDRKGCAVLTRGFDDRIRNAVAHGEIVYRGTDVHYGPLAANYQIPPGDAVNAFDELVRTSNALALAILLFWARNHGQLAHAKVRLPVRLLSRVAAASVDEHLVQFTGAYESEPALVGRQLHIGLRFASANRSFVLLMLGTVAYQLIELGGVDYNRFVFEIDYGEKPPGVVAVQTGTLRRLLEENADQSRFGEILTDPPLLWSDEGPQRTRIRVWWAIVQTRLALAREDRRAGLARRGVVQEHGGYWIREFVSTGVGGLLRARIQVVLRHPTDADDRRRVREIARLAVADARRRWVTRAVGSFHSTWGWPARPRQIEVRIFRADGPLRWLGRGGWAGGNLVAIAEATPRISLRYRHTIVAQPDEVWQRIRLQYGPPKWLRDRATGGDDD